MSNQELESKLKLYRLSQDEYLLIKNLLGREPRPVEWPLFSALWSEHCSYKSSKIHLRKFSYRNEMTPDLEGENAGVVDLGYGEKIAFKMESHNHPSFIEPVQGAATGVGGILRDIFTMGARPIMSANYLCFGEKSADRMQYLMRGVVHGISMYGNCVGVPTVTGQTNIHHKYNKNILVNALSVGYFGPGQPMALSKAKGPGNYVVYVGAKTGRDGVHGASMASASFDDDSESKKPNVQIGDPFYEKLLIESCLEVLDKNLVVAMQDMGAAGLTSSSFEMASKGQVGLVIDLKKVPLRDSTMNPEEILLSESQERMLLICEPSQFSKLQNVFKRWGLEAAVLGEVQSERKIKLLWGDEVLTEIDPDIIVEQAPKYERPYQNWTAKNRTENLNKPKELSSLKVISEAISQMKLNSFTWISKQYDQRVGTRTAKACESSVAFARLDHSGRGLSLVVGCRPEVMEMDAQIGGYDSVYYPSLQMALKGAKVLAVTDCLNFGNPQRPEIMTEFVTSVESIAQASRELNAPVISGNVSFYNETFTENIVSTPATGLVGLRDSVENLVPDDFTLAGQSIVMVELSQIESFAWLSSLEKQVSSFKGQFNQDVVNFIQKTVELDQKLKEKNIKISSSKVIGLGGVAVTCLKMSTENIGFDLSNFEFEESLEQAFKDRLYGFLLTTTEAEPLIQFLKSHFNELPLSIRKIGETIKDKIVLSKSDVIKTQDFSQQISAGL